MISKSLCLWCIPSKVAHDATASFNSARTKTEGIWGKPWSCAVSGLRKAFLSVAPLLT